MGDLGRYFCIWRCQNELERARELENAVKESIDRFYGSGTARFHVKLVLHDGYLCRPASKIVDELESPPFHEAVH